jgi:drug/metabolite transporter (DMT)-like permease
VTHLVLILVQLCFASLAVVGKAALAHVPANAMVLVRVAGGAITFLVLARARGALGVAARDLPRIVVCAVLGLVLNQILFLNGLARTTAVNASVLGSTIPVFTAAIAMLTRREPVRTLRLCGIAVAFTGALILVGADRFSLTEGTTLGNLLILANSLCYGTFLVVVRTLAARIRPLPLVALLFGCAVPFVIPPGIAAWASFAPTGRDLALLGFILAVPTVGAYGLNQVALARAEASLVAAYIYLQPLLATAGAMLLLGERPAPRVFAAGALILGGLALSTARRR